MQRNSWPRRIRLKSVLTILAFTNTTVTTISRAFARHSRILTAPFTSPASKHRISSVRPFTPAELRLYYEYADRKARIPPSPIAQGQIVPQFLLPRIYNLDSSTWAATDNRAQGLERGSILIAASWNLDCNGPDSAARTSAALAHLRHIFGDEPGNLVVMFQEIRRESLEVILGHEWVQRNFCLSNTEPPKSLFKDVHGRSFVLKETMWRAASYFTLMMVSRTLPISNCFRAPFITDMGRDALVVDIPILSAKGLHTRKESFRLCTTHLESLWEGKAYRPGQLAMISALLKGASASGNRIIGGIIGGDMNAIDRSEHDYHRATEVSLNDVWEDETAPPLPILKPFQKDTSYGRARGNTWGYQSARKRDRKRMDKFLYTGSVETFAVDGAQDIAGRVGRLGIGLRTEVEAWELETEECLIVKGELVEKKSKKYLSEEQAIRLQGKDGCGLTRIKTDAWVSDHFGIVVGIRIL